MPDVAVLKRKTQIPEVQKTLGIDKELHERAKHLFGYSTGLNEDGDTQKKQRAAQRVYKACRDLGMELPFTPSSVKEYMDAELRKVQLDNPGKNFHWITRSLNAGTSDSFRDPIPEFVLQSACDLKERIPNCDFRIDVLEEKVTVPVRFDPFLVLIDEAGQRHYIEVWNEPGYKKQRMV